MTFLKDISPGLTELEVNRRKILWFAFILAVILVAFAWRFGGENVRLGQVLAASAMLVSGLALIRWETLTLFYRAWMALALVIGWFLLQMFLIVAFFLFVVPAGFWFRLSGKAGGSGSLSGTGSYWLKVEKLERSRYLKKF